MVTVQPIGSVPTSVLRGVSDALWAQLGLRSRYASRAMRLPAFAYRPRRDQYNANQLLDAIDARADLTSPIVGITAASIFVPGMNFLFGLSYQGRGSALVATAQLEEGRAGKTVTAAKVAKRAGKLAVHEVGHALGLGHCRTPGCVMAYADHVGAVDSESGRLCSRCKRRISEMLMD